MVRSEVLGTFTASELRVAGISRRGFVQPLFSNGSTQEPTEDQAAAVNLSSRALLVEGDDGELRPVGRLGRVVSAAASARSLVACPPAPSGGVGAERVVLSRLGSTDLALDLHPLDEAYEARLIAVEDLVEELLGFVGLVGLPDHADQVAPVAPSGGSGPEMVDRQGQDRTRLRVEAASVSSPEGPLTQQRLHIVFGPAEPWLELGWRHLGATGVESAPAGPNRARRVLESMVRGELADL
jgi:hypothetical protein